jgi:hypothetical protein
MRFVVRWKGMTFRERINPRLRQATIVNAIGLAWFVGSILVGKALGPLWPMGVGSAVFPIIFVLQFWMYQCPSRCSNCGGLLSGFTWPGVYWRMNPLIKFCPYCAYSFHEEEDSELDSLPEVNQGLPANSSSHSNRAAFMSVL